MLLEVALLEELLAADSTLEPLDTTVDHHVHIQGLLSLEEFLARWTWVCRITMYCVVLQQEILAMEALATNVALEPLLSMKGLVNVEAAR